MPAPPRIREWILKVYPKPTIDPEWLDACLTWISEELHLDDVNSQADEIISNVESQLLSSDLRDSMLAGTGFPLDIGAAENTHLPGNILVQIQGITEIGHSAFSLQTVRQTRIDREDLAGLTGDDEQDEGSIPKYPRSMLRFDLTDGSQSLRAIEYRRLPELELGVVPLGYKIVLKDVPIRRGIAFLEPSNVDMKGYMTEELDINREADFVRGLRLRLGQTDSELNEEAFAEEDPPRNPMSPEIVHRATGDLSTAENNDSRAPLREMSTDDSYPRMVPHDELEPPTRRRVPVSSTVAMMSGSSAVVSPYFSNTATTTTSVTLASSSTLASVRLSPVRRNPLPPSTLHNGPNAIEDSFDFSDDMQIDDAFLQELDAAEQAAINTVQLRSRDVEQGNTGPEGPGTPAIAQHFEVVVIDSDSDDKENLAPVIQRRVRPRLAVSGGDDSDIIIIE